MWQYYFNVPNIDGSYWTLIIELLFYVFIYILYVFKLLKNITTIGGVICLFIFLLFFNLDYNVLKNYGDLLPLTYHFPLFYTGILFFKIYENKTKVWVLYPVVILSLMLQFYLHPFGRTTNYMSTFWYATMLLSFSLLFLLFIFGKIKFIANKATKYLGDISYVLYLIHQPIVYATLIPLWIDEMKGDFWISTFYSVLISIVLAMVITYKIEIPLRKYLGQKLLK